MYGDPSHPDIKEYITDDELEFDWEFPFMGGIQMKVRINKGDHKCTAKVGIEIENHAGYYMDVFGDKNSIEGAQKVTVCMEGAYEKYSFIEAILKLALFLKLNGYALGEDENE
tara:strand:- start:375 stop:713 length:339 start_codon:yes stop_codon:yes gene_type:complete